MTLTAFDSRGSRPSGPLRRSMGQIRAGLGPFEPKTFPPLGFLFLWKNTHFEIDFSLLIETIGSQVVVSMFKCSRRPTIFDLPGCHARVDFPECQQEFEIVVRKSCSMGDVLVVVVSSCVLFFHAVGKGIGDHCDVVQSPR